MDAFPELRSFAGHTRSGKTQGSRRARTRSFITGPNESWKKSYLSARRIRLGICGRVLQFLFHCSDRITDLLNSYPNCIWRCIQVFRPILDLFEFNMTSIWFFRLGQHRMISKFLKR